MIMIVMCIVFFKGKKLAAEIGAVEYTECSALTGIHFLKSKILVLQLIGFVTPGENVAEVFKLCIKVALGAKDPAFLRRKERCVMA